MLVRLCMLVQYPSCKAGSFPGSLHHPCPQDDSIWFSTSHMSTKTIFYGTRSMHNPGQLFLEMLYPLATPVLWVLFSNIRKHRCATGTAEHASPNSSNWPVRRVRVLDPYLGSTSPSWLTCPTANPDRMRHYSSWSWACTCTGLIAVGKGMVGKKTELKNKPVKCLKVVPSYSPNQLQGEPVE